MSRNIEMTTLELVVTREALERYGRKAEVSATEYEAELAKGEGNPIPLPWLILVYFRMLLNRFWIL